MSASERMAASCTPGFSSPRAFISGYTALSSASPSSTAASLRLEASSAESSAISSLTLVPFIMITP